MTFSLLRKYSPQCRERSKLCTRFSFPLRLLMTGFSWAERNWRHHVLFSNHKLCTESCYDQSVSRIYSKLVNAYHPYLLYRCEFLYTVNLTFNLCFSILIPFSHCMWAFIAQRVTRSQVFLYLRKVQYILQYKDSFNVKSRSISLFYYVKCPIYFKFVF